MIRRSTTCLVFFFLSLFVCCLAQGVSGPRLILKYYGNANYNFKLDMSAVIWLAVEVINIDLGALFDFVSDNILHSKLGKHGLGETKLYLQNLFSSPVVLHKWTRKSVLNEAGMLSPFLSVFQTGEYRIPILKATEYMESMATRKLESRVRFGNLCLSVEAVVRNK